MRGKQYLRRLYEGQVVELPSLLALSIVFVILLGVAFVISIYANFGTSKTIMLTSNRLPVFHKNSYNLHRFFQQSIDNRHTFYVRCRSGKLTASDQLSFKVNTSLKPGRDSQQQQSTHLRFISLQPMISRIVKDTSPLWKFWKHPLKLLGFKKGKAKPVYDKNSVISFKAVTNKPASCQVELATCGTGIQKCVETADEKTSRWVLGLFGNLKLGRVKSLKKAKNYTAAMQEFTDLQQKPPGFLQTEEGATPAEMRSKLFAKMNAIVFANQKQQLKPVSKRTTIYQAEVDLKDIFASTLVEEKNGKEFWVEYLSAKDNNLFTGRPSTEDISPSLREGLTWFYRYICSSEDQTINTSWGILKLGQEPPSAQKGFELEIKDTTFLSDYDRQQQILNNHTAQILVRTNRQAVCRGGFYNAPYRDLSFSMSNEGNYVHHKNLTFNDPYLVNYNVSIPGLVRQWLYCRQEEYNCSLVYPQQAVHQVREELINSVDPPWKSYYCLKLYNSSGDLIKPFYFASGSKEPRSTITFVAPVTLINGRGKLTYEVSSERRLELSD